MLLVLAIMYIDVATAVTVWKPCSEDCIQLSLYYTIPKKTVGYRLNTGHCRLRACSVFLTLESSYSKVNLENQNQAK